MIGRDQLLAAGFSSSAIGRRVAAGKLHPLYRGVYAVGHRVVSQKGWWMAATLATGVCSATDPPERLALRPWSGRIDVTIPWDKTPREGIVLHRAALAPDEITTRDGIPVTTPARTQLDLAGVLQRHQLQHVINEAERLHLQGAHDLTNRHPTKRGTATLRTLAPPTHTKDLEARFHTFLNDRRFPRPQTNTRRGKVIEGQEVDAAWPDRRLIIELDSWEYHHTRRAFEDDRRRDRQLTASGWTVLRITWRDLDDPGTLERELRALGL